MRISFIAIMLAQALVLSSVVSAQNIEQKQVVVHLADGLVAIPADETQSLISNVTFGTQELEFALTSNNALEIRRVFPSFKPGDIVRTARTGEQVIVPDLSHFWIITLESAGHVPLLLEDLEGLAGMIACAPNGIVTNHSCTPAPSTSCPPGDHPNDRLFQLGSQWSMHNCTLDTADVDALGAWSITTGSGVTIGIVDEGIDDTHEEFVPRVFGDIGFYGPHGTAVAGVAAAAGDNVCGIAGMAGSSFINTQKATGAVDQRANGIYGAISAGADVVNTSWGYNDPNPDLEAIIVYADALNIPIVASAGDGTTQYSYPAEFEQTISVAATDSFDLRWANSQISSRVDVAAPGVDIWTTIPGNSYQLVTGTSYSAAVVTGIAAQLLDMDASLAHDDIRHIIRLTADDINAATMPGPDSHIGWGRVKASRALERLRPPYSFDHFLASGGSVSFETGEYCHYFLGTMGTINPGFYLVRRKEVQKNVTFPTPYVQTPDAWGRGVGTIGLSGASPNFGNGWCFVVPGSITKTGCTLQTNIYYIKDVCPVPTGDEIGINIPVNPSNVVFQYSVVGIKDVSQPQPTVSIPNGGETYKSGDFVDIYWHVDDEYVEGTRSDIILTEYDEMSGETSAWLIAQNQLVDGNGNGSFTWNIWQGFPRTVDTHRIRISTTDTNGQHGTDDCDQYFSVTYRSKGAPLPPIPYEMTSGRPTSFRFGAFIEAPFPNPFNPSTTIRFGIPQRECVALKIYTVGGAVVRAFYDYQHLEAGDHTVTWDGRSDGGEIAASGIYILRFVAGSYNDSKKLILLK